MRCPSNILGLHVWHKRARILRPICRCGLEQPLVEPDSWHILARCPCRGDVGNCEWWWARLREREQRRRIRAAERRRAEAIARYAQAIVEVEYTERAVDRERAALIAAAAERIAS